METEGGGPDPPKEGTRPPDEERTRTTIEVESESAAGEEASPGGSPGGSQTASHDGGSGQELPNVSRGSLPSTTISTNNQESTREDRGGPASKEIPADLKDNVAIITSAAMSECNAGIEGSSGGSLKGEEDEPMAQETMSLDGDSSAGNTRHTAALEAQGADSGSDDELNLGATPPLTDYRSQFTPDSRVYRPFEEKLAPSDLGSQPGPSRATLSGEAEISRSDRPEGGTPAVQSPYAGSDGCQDAQNEKIGASQSEMSSLGGAVRSGIEQGSTSESSLGAGQGVLQGCGTHRAESASPKVSNRAGKRPAEEKEAAPAPAVSRRRPPSPEGVLDPKNDSTGLDTDLFDERDWHGIKTELDEHSTIFAELLVTLQPDDPSTGRELARQAHRDLVHVALWGHQQRTQMQSTVEEMQKEAAEEKDLAAITQMDLESEVNELKSEVLSQSTIVQQVRKDLSLALGQVDDRAQELGQARDLAHTAQMQQSQLQSKLAAREEKLQRCQIRINELEEAQRSGGLPVLSQRERATAEDGLQAKLDEQVRARERLEEEVNRMRNILNQSHDQARMFRDELEATKKKAAARLAKNRKQYEERLRVEKAVAQRAATALTQLETVSQTDAAELLSSLMARQEQDEKVTSLSKEITEAMAEVEEQRSVKEKLQQQYDSLRGQYTHREEQNKRKIASLSRDLKEESRQLKVALAEGEELRDAASQLNHHRRPQGESRCNDPEHLHLEGQLATAKQHTRNVQADLDQEKRRCTNLARSRVEEQEEHRNRERKAQTEHQRLSSVVDSLTDKLKTAEERAESSSTDELSSLRQLVGEQNTQLDDLAARLASLQTAYDEAVRRNVEVQRQHESSKVSIDRLRAQRDVLDARVTALRSSMSADGSQDGASPAEEGNQGKYYALNLHDRQKSLVTRDVDRFMRTIHENPLCFAMVFAYDSTDGDVGGQERALLGAVQFCMQPGLINGSLLWQQSINESSCAFVVRLGFITGLTFNYEMAKASMRGALHAKIGLLRSECDFSLEPERVDRVMDGAEEFHEDWYRRNCVPRLGSRLEQEDHDGPLIMPEWLALTLGASPQSVQKVTEYLFLHGHPEPDFCQADTESSTSTGGPPNMFEGLTRSTPSPAPTASGRPSTAGRGTPTRGAASASFDTEPVSAGPPFSAPRSNRVMLSTPGPRTAAGDSGQQTQLPSRRSSLRSRPRRYPGTSYDESEPQSSEENETDENSDLASSVASEYNLDSVSIIESGRLKEKQLERLLDNEKLSIKTQVVTALKLVARAPVASDGSQSAGEVKALTVNPPPVRVGSREYEKERSKGRYAEHETVKDALIKCFKTCQYANPTSQQREEWWLSSKGRMGLMHLLKRAMEMCFSLDTIHNLLATALAVVPAVSWMMPLQQQLSSIWALFNNLPHIYIEVFLFMCDETAVPNHESVDRWQRDWEALSAKSTLHETATEVENKAIQHLHLSRSELYTKKEIAKKVHDRLIKCLFDSTLKRDQKLVPWLTAELEERLRDEPKGVDQASSQEQRDAIYYRWRSVMELATSKGVRMETQFTTEVAMEEKRSREASGMHAKSSAARPTLQPTVAAMEQQPAAEGASLTRPQLSLPSAITAALPPSTMEAGPRSVGYLGNKLHRPGGGRGIIVLNFWQRNQQELAGYPGGQKAFEEIPLSTYYRDEIAKASVKKEEGTPPKFIPMDFFSAQLLGIVCPLLPMNGDQFPRQTDTKALQTRFGGYGEKSRLIDKTNDTFLSGACAHCASGLNNNGNGPEFLYRQKDKADSAHDWGDCPRVKAALFYWSKELHGYSNCPPCHKNYAVLRRLMMRNPDKYAILDGGQLPCEVSAGKNFIASERPRQQSRNS